METSSGWRKLEIGKGGIEEIGERVDRVVTDWRCSDVTFFNSRPFDDEGRDGVFCNAQDEDFRTRLGVSNLAAASADGVLNG